MQVLHMEQSQAADIKELKMSGWITPASLANKINKLNGK